ncbi:MAG: hypothetical protein OXE02_03455, partial [Chloroflexi bacterium]|nr:hypothetical protein [Chloroflexota bacterium]
GAGGGGGGRGEGRAPPTPLYGVNGGPPGARAADPDPPPRLVLDEAEQRALLDHVTAIAERTVPAEADEAVMTRVRNSLAFLAEETMRTMMREGREEELWKMLTDLVGEQAAAATVDRLRARTSAESSDSR